MGGTVIETGETTVAASAKLKENANPIISTNKAEQKILPDLITALCLPCDIFYNVFAS
jgi:hypothetical protein